MRLRALPSTLVVIGLMAAGAAAAQTGDYPARPVRLLVGFAAGSSADIVARLLAQSLSQRLGQPVIVENRPGAATNIATEAAVRAAPDGYTLLMVLPSNAINATLYDHLNFEFLRDVVPVASLCRNPFVLEVNPSVPAENLPQLIAYARAHPGTLGMASGGNGSGAHVAGELFKMMAGVDLLHVPYRGDGPALTDLVAGRVQVMFGTITSSIAQIRAGKLRALGVTGSMHSDVLAGVPTVAEFVPGYEATGFNGIGAPKGTPPDIVAKLNREIDAALADATMRARLSELGLSILTGSPRDFANLLAAETEKWAKVIRFANIKAQ